MKIQIKWLEDSFDCELCGTSYADGAEVIFDGEPALSLVPSAHCFGGLHHDRDDVFRKIIEKLGHEVSET